MKNQCYPFTPARLRFTLGLLTMLLCFAAGPLLGATAIIYTNNFESYTTVATNLADTANANPTSLEWSIADDTALSPTTAGAGVQVINWLTNASGGANQSLLLRPNSEAQVMLRGARSGSSYQLDFWTYAVREPTSSQNFFVVLRGEGNDNNGDDFLAYQVNRATNSTILRYYDGVGGAAWVNTTANQTTNQWQHHRMVINPNALTFTLYVDDMATPVVADVDISRPDSAVPTQLRILNEGNSADDGYFAIDDINFTVEDSIDLTTTFTEGFESYTARTSDTDDANPQGPWVTTETGGAGSGKLRALGKVQVVGTDVVQPHSGNKCLKLEGGLRAGASIAWGVPPQSDVQITWWAQVPESVVGPSGTEFNYLRMSLYGAENNNTFSGDNALLGYGKRSATVGDGTSLTYYITGWLDSGVDYTPNTWEEYRLTTHMNLGRYTLVKNPSSSPQIITDRTPMVGSATNWFPVFMAAWSSSNGTNHPPVYIDDIEIKSLVSIVDPLPDPYSISFTGTRFTNATVVKLPGVAMGGPVVDPRDNSTIVVAVDATPAGGGGIYRAQKVASGNWSVDPIPIVSGLDRPSSVVMETNGTLWWVHDYTMALMRLKSPWASNTPELVVTNFGNAVTDDDPIALTIAPATFSGSKGSPGMIVVADRGSDVDANNAVNLVDPSTTKLYQTNNTFLVAPTAGDLGGDLTAITSLPASGEVATLSLNGYLVAIDGNGAERYINALNLWPIGGPASAVGIAADPLTGKIWAADNLKDELWSIDASSGADQKEIGFPPLVPSRVERQMDFHDPCLAFSPDGSFLVVSDTSVVNDGGRLIILHNEAFAIPTFSIKSVARNGNQVQLTWSSAGAVKYNVQRATDVANAGSFQNIATNLNMTVLSFTDSSSPTANAFYRVVATP